MNNLFVGIKTYKRNQGVKELIESIREYEPDVFIALVNDEPGNKLDYMSLGIQSYSINQKNKGSNWCNQKLMNLFYNSVYNLDKFILLDDDTICTGPFYKGVMETRGHVYIPNEGNVNKWAWGYVLGGDRELLETIGGFDLDSFGPYGLAHVDFTNRAKRAGLGCATPDLPFKLVPTPSQANKVDFKQNKQKYIKLVQSLDRPIKCRLELLDTEGKKVYTKTFGEAKNKIIETGQSSFKNHKEKK